MGAPTPSETESWSAVPDALRLHGLHSPWNSPGKDTGVGSLSLLQGIFPTQGSNPCLLHCRQILYQVSHKGSPRILEWVAYPFSSRSSQPRNWTGVSCIAGGFFTNWAIREAPIINSANIHWASALEARDKWCIKINFYSHEASKLSFIYLTTIWF